MSTIGEEHIPAIARGTIASLVVITSVALPVAAADGDGCPVDVSPYARFQPIDWERGLPAPQVNLLEDGGAVDGTRRAWLDDPESTLPTRLDLSLGFMSEDAPGAGAPGAAPSDQSAGELAKKAQNPVADLISLPFQNNTGFNYGSDNGTQNVLNIQPVLPFSLNDDWNVITRTIVPLIYQPEIAPGVGDVFGLGDIQFTAFFSPKKPVGGWIVGAGPVFQFPTSTDESLGARKWTAGPSVVALRIEGPWVAGALVQNVWSFAGSGRNDVNAMLVQPFVNYNIEDGWYLTSAPIITANWKADSDNKWLVPLGGGAGRVFRIGKQPVNCSLQAYWNVVNPDVGPEWTLRFQVQLLFPK